MGVCHSAPPPEPEEDRSFETITEKEVDDQFIESGVVEDCKIILAIDFTKSNATRGKECYNERPLHQIDKTVRFLRKETGTVLYTGGECNPYERAIIYSREFLKTGASGVPLYFYGGELQESKQFNGIELIKECTDEYDILQCYRNEADIQRAKPGKSHHLVPVVKKALQRAKHFNSFHVMLIFTCGEVDDIRATANLIAEASQSVPLAFVIVGIGDGPFDNIKQLDKHMPQNKYIDNVQFVELRDIEKKYTNNTRDREFFTQACNEVPRAYTACKEVLGYRAPKQPAGKFTENYEHKTPKSPKKPKPEKPKPKPKPKAVRKPRVRQPSPSGSEHGGSSGSSGSDSDEKNTAPPRTFQRSGGVGGARRSITKREKHVITNEDQAATLLQARWRGRQARKMFQLTRQPTLDRWLHGKPQPRKWYEPTEEDLAKERAQQAAKEAEERRRKLYEQAYLEQLAADKAQDEAEAARKKKEEEEARRREQALRRRKKKKGSRRKLKRGGSKKKVVKKKKKKESSDDDKPPAGLSRNFRGFSPPTPSSDDDDDSVHGGSDSDDAPPILGGNPKKKGYKDLYHYLRATNPHERKKEDLKDKYRGNMRQATAVVESTYDGRGKAHANSDLPKDDDSQTVKKYDARGRAWTGGSNTGFAASSSVLTSSAGGQGSAPPSRQTSKRPSDQWDARGKTRHEYNLQARVGSSSHLDLDKYDAREKTPR